jgi:hypothetical protein
MRPITEPHPIAERLNQLFDMQGDLLAQIGETVAKTAIPVDASKAIMAAISKVNKCRDDVLAVINAPNANINESWHVVVYKLRQAVTELLNPMPPLNAIAPWPSISSWTLSHADDLRMADRDIVYALQAIITPQAGSRSVGFEYQLNYAAVETPGIPSKAVLKRWNDDKGTEILRLEVDGKNVEFITAPVSTPEALTRQLDLIEEEASKLQSVKGEAVVTYATPDPILSDVDGSVIKPAGTQVTVKQPGTVRGKIQATAGRRLSELSAFIIRYGGEIGQSTLDAVQGLGAIGNALPLLHLVNYYIVSLEPGNKNDIEGPKTLVHAMSRTDFHSAYLQLNEDEKASFMTCIDYHGAAGTMDALRNRPICPGYYRGPAGALYQGPLIGDWLDSIVLGDPANEDNEPIDRDNDGEGHRGSGRDLMSPPQGYPAHRLGRHFTYAMGRFGCAADGALLLEVRAIKEDITYNVANLRSQAIEFLNNL